MPLTGRVQFGEFELDPDAHTLTRAGAPVRIQPQPFDVLVALVDAHGHVVSRESLRASIWPSDTFVDFDHGLNIAINKLRAALEDPADAPHFIATVPRRGYRFVGLVERPATPPAFDREAAPADPRPGPSPVFTRPAMGLGAIAGVALAAAASLSLAQRTDALPTPAAQSRRIGSLAVLPLEDLSPNAAANRYFADSLTDELITRLAQLRGVTVVSRTSIVGFAHTRRSLSDIAAALGVDAIVEGTVVRDGGRVRVTAQLIDGATDRHLWARSYEEDLQDLLGLERRVTTEIAAEIGRQVTLEPGPRAVAPSAYDEYLRGRFAWNLRTDAALHEAIGHFIRATAIDPSDAPAYAGLADCYATLGYLSNIVPSDGFQAARAAADRAIALDASLADAHASLAYTHLYYDWDWAGAEREFRLAEALNPNDAIAHEWYAVFLTATMRPGEAQVEIDRAAALDPLSDAIATDAGFALYYSRQYDLAVDRLRVVTARAPAFPLAHLWLGRTFQQKHMFAASLAEFSAVEKALPDWPVSIAASGSVAGWAGDRESARRSLARLADLAGHRYVTAYAYALIEAALGDNDEAIRWLRRGVDERTPWMVWLKLDPRWGGLANDPRFLAIARQVGLP